MNIEKFFYKLYLLNANSLPEKFLGTAFPISPNGGLLTCRHVLNVGVPNGHVLGVYDDEKKAYSRIVSEPLYPADVRVDMAFIPNALSRPKAEFFPILRPPTLLIGEDVYSYGYFSIGGNSLDVEAGYFGGKIINFFSTENVDNVKLTVPFAILEGMSGCPIITYHNGPKVVGIGIGNRSSRILASETVEYEDSKLQMRESINRIVEFGVAHHCVSMARFLSAAGVQGFVVSDDRIQIPGL